MTHTEKTVRDIFLKAGITFNGKNSYDITVIDSRCFKHILAHGNLGIGESYMNGWIECNDISLMITKLIEARIDSYKTWNLNDILLFLNARLFNRQSISRASLVAVQHYDIGNDLYELMLDPKMFYTCGYWKDAKNLDEAQMAKAHLTAEKLKLSSSDNLLDIGFGWGSFQNYAWENYRTPSTGISISKEQLEYVNEKNKNPNIKFEFKDYRNLDGKFNKVVSIGMFEHVGPKNHRTYLESVNRVMEDDGLFLLHFIGAEDSKVSEDPWIDKYIFTNSVLPSLSQVIKASEGLFTTLDVQNFGVYYDKTLMAWFLNFDRNWLKIKEKYGDRFYRMWKYYLLMCAGSFRSGKNQLYQIVFSKVRNPKDYVAER